MEAQTPEPVVSRTLRGSGWVAALNRQGYSTLEDYRRSGRWKATEAEFQARNPARECLCGKQTGLQVTHVSLHHVGREQQQDLAWLCGRCRTLLRPLVRSGQINSLAAAKHALTTPTALGDSNMCLGTMDCPCPRCQAEILARREAGVRPSQGLPTKP